MGTSFCAAFLLSVGIGVLFSLRFSGELFLDTLGYRAESVAELVAFLFSGSYLGSPAAVIPFIGFTLLALAATTFVWLRAGAVFSLRRWASGKPVVFLEREACPRVRVGRFRTRFWIPVAALAVLALGVLIREAGLEHLQHRRRTEAAALRQSVTEIEAALNEDRTAPPTGRVDRLTLAATLGADLRRLRESPELGLATGPPEVVGLRPDLNLFRPLVYRDSTLGTNVGEALVPTPDTTDRLFALIRSGDWSDRLVAMASAPLPARRVFVPDDADRSTPEATLWWTFLNEADEVGSFSLALLRHSVIVGDLASFSIALDGCWSLFALIDDAAGISGMGEGNRYLVELCRHLDWAARVRRTQPWLDAIEACLAGIKPMPPKQRLTHMAILNRDSMCIELARSRARPASPNVQNRASGLQMLLGEILGLDEPDGRLPRGSITVALKAATDVYQHVADLEAERPWTARRLAIVRPDSPLRRLETVPSVLEYLSIPEDFDRITLLLQSTRLTVKLERYALAFGEYPTERDFVRIFTSDPNAKDPYSLGLLGYSRIAAEELNGNEEPITIAPPRGFVLYSRGMDAHDDEAKFPIGYPSSLKKEVWTLRTGMHSTVPEIDIKLPDALWGPRARFSLDSNTK